MTVLRRPSAASRVLDLTRRLAEDYDDVPLPDVSRTVQSAAQVVAPDGTGAVDLIAEIEQLAREDLGGLARHG